MNDTYCLIITNKKYSDNYISRRNCSYKYILRKNGPLGEIILNTNNRIKIKMMIKTTSGTGGDLVKLPFKS